MGKPPILRTNKYLALFILLSTLKSLIPFLLHFSIKRRICLAKLHWYQDINEIVPFHDCVGSFSAYISEEYKIICFYVNQPDFGYWKSVKITGFPRPVKTGMSTLFPSLFPLWHNCHAMEIMLLHSPHPDNLDVTKRVTRKKRPFRSIPPTTKKWHLNWLLEQLFSIVEI